MIDYTGHLKFLQNKIEIVVNKQVNERGEFIDWEDWFKYLFNPLNEQYKIMFQLPLNLFEKKPKYINYEDRMEYLMISDCDMTEY